MNRNLLVFAAKRGGYELCQYLFSLDVPPDRVIVADRSDTDIIQLSSDHGIPVTVYDGNIIDWLPAEGKRYRWLLNLWSPHILRQQVLGLAEHRLNIHPGLVPLCRGNDNAAWTLREQIPAGVSLIEMGPEVDDGAAYCQREIPCPFPLSGKELNSRLYLAANALFRECWPAIFAGEILPVPQLGQSGYHTRRETNLDRVKNSDENITVGECLQWILAHDFSPGTTAEVLHNGKRYRVKVTIEELEQN